MTIIFHMQRDLYQKLIRWKQQDDRNPLILLGVRQCGKTYLLQYFGENEFQRVHYLNFEKDIDLHSLFSESLDPQRILQALRFYLDTTIDLQHDLLIFDEIQACPNALTSLKYFAEEVPQLAVCAAGSLLGVALNDVSFPVGKVQFQSLHAMTFCEFLQALGDSKALDALASCTSMALPRLVHDYLWERVKWYFIVGGLPEAVSTFIKYQDDLYSAFQQVREKQKDLIAAYLADMAKHAGKINAMHLDRIWQAVPAQLARHQDGHTSRFQFKDVVPGIDRYQRLANAIDWLLAAGLVIKTPLVNQAQFPLSAYTKESFFKLYLFDVGLLGALSGLPPKVLLDQQYGTYKGYFAENFVAQELIAKGHTLYSWQEGQSEVEFVVASEAAIIPIEVKSGKNVRAKSLQKFAQKYQPPYHVRISAKPWRVDNGLHQYPLYLAHRFPIEEEK